MEEGDAPSASMVVEENGSKEPSKGEMKLEEFPIEQVKSETNNIGGPEEGSRIIILRPKRAEDGTVRPVKVVLERPSTRMSQHLKPLHINAHFDGLPIDRVLVDGGSVINVMP